MTEHRLDRDSFFHWESIVVRWSDMDAFGHVNNALFFTYMEQARIDMFLEVFREVSTTAMAGGPIVAHIECNIRVPVLYPSSLEIGSRIARIGRSSFKLDQAIFLRDTDTRVADGSTTCVWMDYSAGKPKPLSEEQRAELTKFQLN